MRMRMTVLVCTVALGLQSYGQDVSVQLHASENYLLLHSDKFIKQFQKGYEDYQGSLLDKGFHLKGIPRYTEFGATFWTLQNFGFRYAFYQTHWSQEATFTNGNARVLEYQQTCPFQGGAVFGNKDHFNFGLNIGVCNSLFTSKYVYASGVEDISGALSLNGVYSSFCFTMGADMQYHFTKHLAFNASYISLIGSQYSDKNYLKGVDNNSAYDTNMFPADYPGYVSTVNAGASYEYDYDSFAKCRFRGLSLGLTYTLNLN